MSSSRSPSSGQEDEPALSLPSRPAGQFRNLAPKPPESLSRIARRSPVARASSSIPSLRQNPRVCRFCGRLRCTLATHRAYWDRNLSGAADPASLEASMNRLRNTPYVESYSYAHYRVYIDRDIAASRLDPFLELPISERPNINELHSLFFDFFIIDPQKAVTIPRPREMTSDLLCSPSFVPAMQDPALCLSVLSYAAAGQRMRRGEKPSDVITFSLMGEAMQTLRERLNPQTKVSDASILAATYLWAVNSFIGDAVAMNSHAKSVFALVEARGGLAKLGLNGAIARSIRWVDVTNALVCYQECHFRDTMAIVPIRWSIESKYGAFFETHRSTEILSPDVLKVCRELRQTTEAVEMAEIDGISGPQHLTIMSRLMATGAQLVSLGVQMRETDSMNECVVYAALVFQAVVFHSARDQRTMLVIEADRLSNALRKTGGPRTWTNDMDMLVWTLFISQIVPHDYDDRDWCMDLLFRALSPRYDDARWPSERQEEIEDMLVQFIWSRSRLSRTLARICTTLQERLTAREPG